MVISKLGCQSVAAHEKYRSKDVPVVKLEVVHVGVKLPALPIEVYTIAGIFAAGEIQ